VLLQLGEICKSDGAEDNLTLICSTLCYNIELLRPKFFRALDLETIKNNFYSFMRMLIWICYGDLISALNRLFELNVMQVL
jgi:hypothetical protein